MRRQHGKAAVPIRRGFVNGGREERNTQSADRCKKWPVHCLLHILQHILQHTLQPGLPEFLFLQARFCLKKARVRFQASAAAAES